MDNNGYFSRSFLTKGKRLMHLGGAEFQIPAIDCAKKLGCFVITVDNRPENPGHRLADIYENVSTVDRVSVLELARKYKIDGIMTYGSDIAAPTVCFVAEKMGLPGNPLAAAEVLQRKDLFRQFQKDNGIPHPDFVVVDSIESARQSYDLLGGKVVVKASDSSGSKGQTIISSVDDAEDAYNRALAFSRCGLVVFERFLPPDILELDGDVLVKNGRLAFRHYGHNYFPRTYETFAPCGEIFPGFFDEGVSAQIDKQFQQIIAVMGINSGCMNFDAILSGGVVYLLEIGLRNGGNYVPYLIKESTGFDLTLAAVLSALGEEVPCDRFFEPNPLPVASYILNSSQQGRFEGFDLSPQVEKLVIGSRLFSEIDSHVLPFTRGDRALGIVFFRFPDMESLRSIMDEIDSHVTLRVLPDNIIPSTIGSTDSNDAAFSYARYSELLSPFLRKKLVEAEQKGDETVVRVLSRQFVQSDYESARADGEGQKHYEAGIGVEFEGVTLHGIERLYERVIVVEPLLQCIAHCRHCLRRYYEPFHISNEDLSRIARYIGSSPENSGVREILVTGGDPFLVPDRLQHFLDEVSQYAPQIRIVRIASRLPIHQPDWVSERILSVLGGQYGFQVEVATQVNHAIELFPETVAAFRRILKVVRLVYNQTVMLAGVNDSLDDLVDLCNGLRDTGIENHYLFHCVPLAGVTSLRVPLERTIELVSQLSACGRVSGRAKPKLCIMTDIGKITLYEGAILERRGNRFLLQSTYKYEDRITWNKGWELPQNAEVDENGLLRIWYVDV